MHVGSYEVWKGQSACGIEGITYSSDSENSL